MGCGGSHYANYFRNMFYDLRGCKLLVWRTSIRYHFINIQVAKSSTKVFKKKVLVAFEFYQFSSMFFKKKIKITLIFRFIAFKVSGKTRGVTRWNRSHSPSRRYNIMMNNIFESMNAALLKVRELPITAFVNEIRLLCQRWFFERRNKAKDFTSKMSKDVEKKLEKRRDRAQIMDVSCLTFFFYLSFILIMLKYYINCMERKKKRTNFFSQ